VVNLWYISTSGYRPPSLIYHALTMTKVSIRTSAVMLFDLKNIGIAVGLLFLSRIAALHVISCALPVPGRYL